MGAFVGGLYAREGDLLTAAARTKQFSGRIGNIWRMLSDLTYPIVAYTTGHEFNRAIFKVKSCISAFTFELMIVHCRRSTTFTSKTCGSHSFATRRTF